MSILRRKGCDVNMLGRFIMMPDDPQIYSTTDADVCYNMTKLGMMNMLDTLYKSEAIDREIVEIFLNQTDDEFIKISANYILKGMFS